MPIGKRLARELENVHTDAERLITALLRRERVVAISPNAVGEEDRSASEIADMTADTE